MDKYFQFERSTPPYLPDFVEGDLTFQNDPAESHLFEQLYPFAVVDRHLGRAVDIETGKVVFEEIVHTEVLDNYPVRFYVIEKRELIKHLFDFGVFYERVKCYIYFFGIITCKTNKTGKVFPGKILAPLPCVELLQAAVDSIRSVFQSGYRGIEVSRRSQQFGHIQLLFLPFWRSFVQESINPLFRIFSSGKRGK